MLVICSKKLRERASIVYWEGILRVALFLLLAGYGFFGGIGFAMALVGIVDLVIGLGYVLGLPRSLEARAGDLLMDRV